MVPHNSGGASEHRRLRHACEASTAQASLHGPPSPIIVPVRKIHPPIHQQTLDQRNSAQRGGMLSTRAGRRKWCHTTAVVPVNNGDFGTRARHLPRKRPYTVHHRITYKKTIRADTAVRPYAEDFDSVNRSRIVTYQRNSAQRPYTIEFTLAVLVDVWSAMPSAANFLLCYACGRQ